MKKFTAIALVVVMLLVSVPFVTPVVADNGITTESELLAAMKANQSVVLGADIDISSGWETISTYSKTLDGNGYTITVPSDKPIIDKLTGTVRDVVLSGTMALDHNDRSATIIYGDVNGRPVGVLANWAQGATVANVHSRVNLTFDGSGLSISFTDPSTTAQNKLDPEYGVSVGGLLGFACGSINASKKEYTGRATIQYCSVGGSLTFTFNSQKDFVDTHSGGTRKVQQDRENAGGIIGSAWAGVNVTNCNVYASITTNYAGGNRGGIIGHVQMASFADMSSGAASVTNSKSYIITIKETIFSGTWINNNDQGERSAGIVGYASGLNIISCANNGGTFSGGTRVAILGYANVGTSNPLLLEGCIAHPANAGGTMVNIKCASGGATFRNNFVCLKEGNKINSNTTAGTIEGIVNEGNNEDANKDRLTLKKEFVAANPGAFCLDKDNNIRPIKPVAEANEFKMASWHTNYGYSLESDIDISNVGWTTIPELSTALYGNGYTITVPNDTAFINKLSGIVKDLKLAGSMTLDNGDVSDYAVANDVKGYGLGILANYAWGATIENVDIDVDVAFSQAELKTVNFGGIVGNAWAAHSFTNKDVKIDRATTIKNCTVEGNWTLNFKAASQTSGAADYYQNYKNAVGGAVGMLAGNNTVERTAVYVTATVNNSFGQNGGVIGSAHTRQYFVTGTDRPTNEASVIRPSTINKCLFDGNFVFGGNYGVDQSGAIVGYASGLSLTNCYASGFWHATKGGGSRGIISYAYSEDGNHQVVTIDGCAAVGVYKNSKGNIENSVIGLRECATLAKAKNNLLMTNQVVTVWDKSWAAIENGTQSENNTVIGNAAAVNAEFVRLNSADFALTKDGKVILAKTISTVDDLKTMENSAADFVLLNDIDLTNAAWVSINGFTGNLDGAGYTITLKDSALFDTLEGNVENLVLAGSITKTNVADAINLGALACVANNVEITNVVNNASISVTYSASGKGGAIGGLIGSAGTSATDTYRLRVSDCENNANISVSTHADGNNPNVGGIVGYTTTTHSSYIKTTVNTGDLALAPKYTGNVGGIVGRADNRPIYQGNQWHNSVDASDDLYIYQCANRGDFTGTISDERAAGICGYFGDTAVDYCYNTGVINLANTDRQFGICGYTNTGSRSASIKNSYVLVEGYSVNSCFGGGKATNLTLLNNFYGAASGLKEYSTAGEYGQDANGNLGANEPFTNAADLLSRLDANVFVADVCGRNNGYPVFAWEAHEIVDIYEDGGKNYITTGKDLECGKYTHEEFTGYIQFAENQGNTYARVIMAIDKDELENATYSSFDLKLTLNGSQTATINSTSMIAYESVQALGVDYYGDNCYLFGYVINFGTIDVQSLSVEIVEGANTMYSASYTAN